MKTLLISLILLIGCNKTTTSGTGVNPQSLSNLSLVFASAPTTGSAGDCVGPFIAQLNDPSGQIATGTQEITVNLQTQAAHGETFVDQSCVIPASQGIIPEGSSSVDIYFRDKKVEAANINLTSPAGNVAQTFIMVAGVTASIQFIGPTSAHQNVCSGPFAVTTSDNYGNVNTDSVHAITSSAYLFLYSDAGCTAGVTTFSSGGSFYIKDSKIENPLINFVSTTVNVAQSFSIPINP